MADNEPQIPPIPSGFWDQCYKWIFSQSVPTVLLILLLIGGVYGAKVIIPNHLTQIQNGYERLSSQNGQAFERAAGDLHKTAETFDKESERQYKLISRMQDREDMRQGVTPPRQEPK